MKKKNNNDCVKKKYKEKKNQNYLSIFLIKKPQWRSHGSSIFTKRKENEKRNGSVKKKYKEKKKKIVFQFF